MEAIGLLLAFGIAAAVLAVAHHKVHVKQQGWIAGARVFCLDDSAVHRGFLKLSLAGTIDGFDVTVDESGRGDEKSTTIVVDSRGRISNRVELRAEGIVSGLTKAFTGPDVETGHDAFDDEVVVWGNPTLLASLLDAETRRRVLHFVSRGGRVRNGRLELTVPGELTTSGEVVGLMRESLELTGNLVEPGHLAEKLGQNAVWDPIAGVRAACLRRLLERFPSHPVVAETLKTLLRDPDEEVRLVAACAAGDEGVEVLLEIVRSADTEPFQAAMAVGALGARLPIGVAMVTLERALVRAQLGLAGAVIEALGRIGSERAVDRLTDLLVFDQEQVAVEAARALGLSGAASAEWALLAALAQPSAAVQIAAAEALGKLGTIGAVSALRSTAEENRFDARPAPRRGSSHLPPTSPVQSRSLRQIRAAKSRSASHGRRA
jgi:hypothetical protein